jgi:hypothetical protein
LKEECDESGSRLLYEWAWPSVGVAALVAQQVMCLAHSSSSSRNAPASDSAAAAAFTLKSALQIVEEQLSDVLELQRQQQQQQQQGKLQQVSFAVQVAEAAARASARLFDIPHQRPRPLRTTCAAIASTSVSLVTGCALCAAAAAEVPQVLQACTSLLLTIASCTQRSKDAFVVHLLRRSAKLLTAVSLWKSQQQRQQQGQQQGQQQQQVHADVAAYQLPSASWFLLGRCMLQISDHLQRCALEPDCHSLLGWLLPSVALAGASSAGLSKARQSMAQNQLNELALLLADLEAVLKKCANDMHSSSSSSSSSGGSSSTSSSGGGFWVDHCAMQLRTAYQALSQKAGPAAATLAGRLPELVCWIQALEGDSSSSGGGNISSSSSSSSSSGSQRKGFTPVIRTPLLDLASGLGVAGGALCTALPTRFFCNNPSCSNMAGVSAGFALVRGKGCVCGGCVGLAAGAAVPQDAVAAR